MLETGATCASAHSDAGWTGLLLLLCLLDLLHLLWSADCGTWSRGHGDGHCWLLVLVLIHYGRWSILSGVSRVDDDGGSINQYSRKGQYRQKTPTG